MLGSQRWLEKFVARRSYSAIRAQRWRGIHQKNSHRVKVTAKIWKSLWFGTNKTGTIPGQPTGILYLLITDSGVPLQRLCTNGVEVGAQTLGRPKRQPIVVLLSSKHVENFRFDGRLFKACSCSGPCLSLSQESLLLSLSLFFFFLFCCTHGGLSHRTRQR